MWIPSFLSNCIIHAVVIFQLMLESPGLISCPHPLLLLISDVAVTTGLTKSYKNDTVLRMSFFCLSVQQNPTSFWLPYGHLSLLMTVDSHHTVRKLCPCDASQSHALTIYHKQNSFQPPFIFVYNLVGLSGYNNSFGLTKP